MAICTSKMNLKLGELKFVLEDNMALYVWIMSSWKAKLYLLCAHNLDFLDMVSMNVNVSLSGLNTCNLTKKFTMLYHVYILVCIL